MRSQTISVTVNGEPRETWAETLADLIASEKFGETRIATAVNGAFVPMRARGERQLYAGDRIEILSARRGGKPGLYSMSSTTAPFTALDAGGERRLDERIDIAVEHVVGRCRLLSGAEVLNELIGLQNI